MSRLAPWQLRAAFASRLSEVYGREVPAYTTLVQVAHEVNAEVVAARGQVAERLGSVARVSAERHGAIRLGTPAELAQVATVFGALGMHPVGFYDLREAASPVPVVSTAFRPLAADELARNPFRVFTSVLTSSDRRFFSADLQARLEGFLASRQLFGPELLELAARAEADHGLPPQDAERFLALATAAFALSPEPVDRAWYDELEAVSAVAADIGGVRSTHVNHLTPRVLDIDELYVRMGARGITMIDDIQGPPAWEGPDVLLRQTSFRALAEPRTFRLPDGTLTRGDLRVRFGEVEARGVALTPAGRAVYDAAVAEVAALGLPTAEERQAAAVRVWQRSFPATESGLFDAGLAYAEHRVVDGRPVRVPIVYEDFLPQSAAGIFASNLATSPATAAVTDGPVAGVELDAGWLAGAMGREVADPFELYAAQEAASAGAVAAGRTSGRGVGTGRAGRRVGRRVGAMTSTDAPEGPRTDPDHLRTEALAVLDRLGAAVPSPHEDGPALAARTPLTGDELFPVAAATAHDVDVAVRAAAGAFLVWRSTPAPVRGATVKRLGELLTAHKADLARLVTLEAGKITSEALGEVQEMIDVCDLAVGLSRQVGGRTMPSERPGHRLMETWHPLGVVAVISAFNFPVAVWAWNTAVALVCGDPVVWKPSELTPLTALACSALLDRALAETGAPAEVSRLVLGGREVGEALVAHPQVALVSATGSTRMGAEVGPVVAARFGRALLELGGNNAAVVAPSADLDLAVRGIVFAAVGTAGQRCTTMRRLLVHADVVEEVVDRLRTAYDRLPVGDPRAEGTLVGPLVGASAAEAMQRALARAVADGGEVVAGGEPVSVHGAEGAAYVRPALVRMPSQTDVVTEETFAPVLYVMSYTHLEEAVAVHNAVPQGLSSSIFTTDVREAERFLSEAGSDCGIVNVNIGTSGAEIGGAFGGEKATGGGRESGSDAWRSYMRRATNTVNYSDELPLAQGVDFG